MITVAQVITDTKQIIARDRIDDDDLDYNRLVYLGMLELMHQVDLETLEQSYSFTVTSGENQFEMPLDLFRAKGLFDSSNYIIEQWNTSQWDSYSKPALEKVYAWTIRKARLTAFKSNGTVGVTNGSTNVTVSAADATTSEINRFLRVQGDEQVYRITARPSASSYTLERAYLGTTNGTASYAISPAGTPYGEFYDTLESDASYRLEYWRKPLIITSTNDYPDIPERYHNILKYWCKVAYSRSDDQNQLELALQQAVQQTNTIDMRSLPEQARVHRTVIRTPDGNNKYNPRQLRR